MHIMVNYEGAAFDRSQLSLYGLYGHYPRASNHHNVVVVLQRSDRIDHASERRRDAHSSHRRAASPATAYAVCFGTN